MRFSLTGIIASITVLTASSSASISEYHDSMLQYHMENAYQAPLHNIDSEDRIPETYHVYLQSGYTLDEHKLRLGDELSNEDIEDVLEMGQITYTAKLSDRSLSAVRADSGVELVECAIKFHPC